MRRVILLCLMAAISSAEMNPSSVTGSALSDDDLADILEADVNGDLQPHTSLEGFAKYRTIYFDPVNDHCDGQPSKFMCPGEYEKSRRTGSTPICVSEDQLCDQRNDCPGGEDEHRLSCQYHVLRRQQALGIVRELAEVEGIQDDLAQIRQSVDRKKQQLHNYQYPRSKVFRHAKPRL